MTHPLRHIPATTPPPPSAEAIALDRALDAWVAGDTTALAALDPAMEETVAQLYAWADIAGESRSAEAGEAAMPAPSSRTRAAASPTLPNRRPPHTLAPAPHDLRPPRTHSRRTRIMTAVTGLAAALVLGLSIYGAVPLITNRHADPTPSEIAFQGQASATPDAPTRDVPPELIFTGGDPLPAGGNQTVLPPVGTELTGAWGVDALNPVHPNECAAVPMSRDAAVTILTTPPASDPQPTNQDSTVDEATVAEIQASFREWQACRRAGNTFGAMALETDAFIRADLYDDGGAMASYQRADRAYSVEAAKGVLDVRVSIDEQRAAISDQQASDRAGSESGLDLNLWIIDMQSLGSDRTPAGQAPAVADGTYVWVTAIWTNPNVTSDQPFPRVALAFRLEDGVWKIDQWILLGGSPSSGS